MDKTFASGLMWFRRDLRTDDNAALYMAVQTCREVHCAFVFDREILDPLPRADRRVEFIRDCLAELDEALRTLAGKPHAGLIVCHGVASEEVVRLAMQLGVQSVFAAQDYEPLATARDHRVMGALADAGIALHLVKDQVVLHQRELQTAAGTPYTVFTPYRKAWRQKVDAPLLREHDCSAQGQVLAARPEGLRAAIPSLEQLGFARTNLHTLQLPAGPSGARTLFSDFFERMDEYGLARDFPAVKGPSYLGVHLRFGTVSIRKLVATALQRCLGGSTGAATWLGELIWREFYFQILANFPHVAGGAFKPAYDAIRWEKGRRANTRFAAWREARTGYPLVDAAMEQIRQTGYMHNRLRMVAASFLIKDLGVDWRRGEAYFAEQLNDYDLAANNGGWQWVASSGCDAQPWFRVFNPVRQSQRFDPQGRFIRRYLPQLAQVPDAAIHAPWTLSPIELEAAGVRLGTDYPHPIVDHDVARAETLARYAVVRQPKA